ncbi:MAG TPA: hypothetical protein VJ972_13545 [Anaerolineales bacterium]|nr:hypothetical protein [Anaerolineales bacterium]
MQTTTWQFLNRILLTTSLLVTAACIPMIIDKNVAEANPSEVSTSTVIEKAPKIYHYNDSLSASQLVDKLFTPQWKTLWLTGRLIDQNKLLVYYVNAWMGRDGRGSLVVSEALNELVGQPDTLGTLPVAEEQLSGDSQVSRAGSTDWLNVKGQWKFHPFEKSDRFISLFFPLSLPHDIDWQIVGSSTVAGRKAVVMKGGTFRFWEDMETGSILRLEVYSSNQQDTFLVSIQVEAIKYNPVLPARTSQVVPQDGHKPSLAEQPAGRGIDLAERPLNFHYITQDVNNPSAGHMIDVYLGSLFLGTLDLGSAGFYCSRAADWNHFAFLHQPQDKLVNELRWVDLRNIEIVNTVTGIQSPSRPTWSPTTLQLAVTGYRMGEDPRQWKTFLLTIPSGKITELGAGSLVPPAWTDDGKYVFGLEPTYDNLLMFDAQTGKQISSWSFDSEKWQVTDSSAPINNDEIREKLSRTGFDYLVKCTLP